MNDVSTWMSGTTPLAAFATSTSSICHIKDEMGRQQYRQQARPDERHQ
jgi:hypothetical protein